MPKIVYRETRLYPVVIHREGDVWGYHSPEFGGGGAASREQALFAAQELLDTAVADVFERGEDAPQPSSLDQVDADGGHVAWFPVRISNAADRISITLPKSLIVRIDAITNNRSAFFTELARDRIVSLRDDAGSS